MRPEDHIARKFLKKSMLRRVLTYTMRVVFNLFCFCDIRTWALQHGADKQKPMRDGQPYNLRPIGDWLQRLGTLHRNINPRLGPAPHKPVLLLTLLDMIDRGQISENRVKITPELVATFRVYWRAFVSEGRWQERIVLPFRHLVYEGWWELIKNDHPVSKQALGDPTSIRQLIEKVDGGRFSADLWELLQDPMIRATFREHLKTTYFPVIAGSPYEAVASSLFEVVADPLAADVERLIAEAANGRFRLKPSRSEQDSDYAYLRHHIFPRVVKDLYKNTCAICGLAVHTDRGDTVIDAAHIVPFAESHNDDPRNGLALCKNHHWSFDHGWFSLTDNYRVIVSSRVRNASPFLIEGVPITLPDHSQYAPAKDALAWHRTHWLS